MVFASVPSTGSKRDRCMGGIWERCRSQADVGSRYCRTHSLPFDRQVAKRLRADEQVDDGENREDDPGDEVGVLEGRSQDGKRAEGDEGEADAASNRDALSTKDDGVSHADGKFAKMDKGGGRASWRTMGAIFGFFFGAPGILYVEDYAHFQQFGLHLIPSWQRKAALFFAIGMAACMVLIIVTVFMVLFSYIIHPCVTVVGR